MYVLHMWGIYVVENMTINTAHYVWLNGKLNIFSYIYRVSQKKRNGRVLEFCLIPTVIPLTLLDRTPSIFKKEHEEHQHWLRTFYFSNLLCIVILGFYHWWVHSKIPDQSIFHSGFCSGQQVIFLTIMFREWFVRYNDTNNNVG